eukprot:1277658-Amphidinium_carterae.1
MGAGTKGKARRILAAFPLQARAHTATLLRPEEFSVPVCPFSDLRAGQVAVVPRNDVPEAIQAVAYTKLPTAMVSTQPAAELHLRGYSGLQIYPHLLVHTGDADRLEIHCTAASHHRMYKISAKLLAAMGWHDIRPQTIAQLLDDIILLHSYEHITVRTDGAATFFVHSSVVDRVLSASGIRGAFFKPHTSSMLPVASSLEDARSFLER